MTQKKGLLHEVFQLRATAPFRMRLEFELVRGVL